MTVYLFRRVFRLGIALWLAVSVVFIVLRLAGDPALHLAGFEADPQARDHLARYLGLDRPLWDQYIQYFANIASGDFGRSFRDGRDAMAVVLERLPQTLLLGGLSFLFALGVGGTLGVAAALRRGSALDRGIVSLAIAGYSMPNFLFGILAILLFGLLLQMLPTAGSGGPAHYILPVLTLGTAWAGVIVRFVRSSVLEVVDRPFVRAARARGLGRATVFLHHVLRNAMIPTVLISGFLIGGIVSGAVVTETVFAWPGVGRLLVAAVSTRDLPVVQACMILIVLAMVVANLTADVFAALLDPRVRAA